MTLSAKLQPPKHTQLAETGENTCSMLQGRPLIHALSLWMEVNVFSEDDSKTFKQEISQFLVTDFSVLELYLMPRGHVYGDMILHLLSLYTTVQMLTVTLDSHMMSETCHATCLCDQRSNWRRQTIPLNDLKEVQILGFEGKDHEIDFLKVLLRCTAMLESVTLRFSKEVPPSDDERMKIHNILEAYPSVECKIYHKFERRFYRGGRFSDGWDSCDRR